jgi:hypothetical protein
MTLKKLFMSLLFLILIACFSCHSQENTEVISIGFHSDDCDDCNVLKSRMKKMNRKFFTSPIVFIKYDKTNAKTQAKAEEKLKEWGMLEIAQEVSGLKKVILYDAITKEKIVQLDYLDSVKQLERKIRNALEN